MTVFRLGAASLSRFMAELPSMPGSRTSMSTTSALSLRLGARIHLVSAYEPVPEGRLRSDVQDVPDDLQWAINPRSEVNATLEQAAETVQEAGIEVDSYAREGDPADAILDVAEEQGADLI